MLKVIAIVQARSSSRRLPNKVLLPLGGQPVIIGLLRRLQLVPSLEKIVLATSEDSSDDALAHEVTSHGFDVVRGPLDDVYERFIQVLDKYPCEFCIRITGDCPLIDPVWIEKIYRAHLNADADYTSNALEPTLPDGMDCEVIRSQVLKSCRVKNLSEVDREHVTHYIWNHPQEFNLQSIKNH